MTVPLRRIGLFGLFGIGNLGNEGSLEAMVMFLRRVRPDAQLVCVCAVPEIVQRDHRIAATGLSTPGPDSAWLRTVDKVLLGVPRRLGNWLQAVRVVRGFDMLIIPGTGILDDFGAGPLGMPYALFRWCLAARLCGTGLWFVSIGAGPIHHPVSRWLMKAAARVAHYRSYRDDISRAYMESIGFDTRGDALFPDLAFKLPAPAAAAPRPLEAGRVTVGLGVMTYYGWYNDARGGAALYQAHVAKMTRFVLWLLDHGHHVRLLQGEASDQRMVDDLLAAVGTQVHGLARDRLVAEPTRSLHALMAEIARCDIVVATRFHNIVSALKLGRPTVSIGYARKNEVLLAEMGLADFCQHIERLDVDLLIRQFTALVAQRQCYERSIRDATQALVNRLDHQEDILGARLLGLSI